MTEFVDRVDLDELDFDEEYCDRSKEIAPYKIFGVAILGAVIGFTGYYIYTRLAGDRRSDLGDCLMSIARENICSFTGFSK